MIDVARLAGVAESTVSRAFATPDVISDDVVKKVMQAAKELNYTVNATARSLARNRADAVLVLIPDIGSAYFSAVLKGIEQTARTLSMSVLVGEIGSNPDNILRYVEQVNSQRADGVILLTGRVPVKMEMLGATGKKGPNFPFIVIGACEPESPLVTIGVDNEQAAYKATRYLATLGHTSIAHISGPESSAEARARFDGYSRALKDAGIELRQDYIRNGDMVAETGRTFGVDLGLLKDRPTAIFCGNDEMAIGVIAGLRSCGLNVPKDVSVVGFDDSYLAEMLNPPLTTIRQPSYELGHQAMLAFNHQLSSKEEHFESVILETQLIIRESCIPVS
ncbi:LacI family DNA-binding transcriptional regulator [uncultured Cohaesibacter sp.]|uniref:LacI family DNA-binding transcriptional regulator n=1 Tax=uncultured Cohaesibacter sp. TaxID=1002546 RepID=UPI00292D3BF6|nr:LacI family DNA-binding transcriptional regulator [uncultured Cohaesibacter sp.]